MSVAPVWSERAELTERLTVVLDAMGSTPDEVRTTIESAGIKGERLSARRCPVALYLRSQGFPNPAVTSYRGIVWINGTNNDYRVAVPMPDPINGFIDRFDQSLYPGLIAEPSDS